MANLTKGTTPELGESFPKRSAALVTGGSRGIGRAICRRLAADGYRVIVHYSADRAAAEQTALESGNARIVQADFSSPADLRRMFEDLGSEPLDVLVNNAGIWKPTPVVTSTAAQIDEMLRVNLTAQFEVTQLALPLLADGARIVNVSSVAGRIGVAGGRSLYGATKAAMDAFTRNWALELAPRRILVNAVAPGYIISDMTAVHLSDPATLERALSRHPLGRLGTPDDVAGVVSFLCSDDARFVTGQSINVSGGFVI